MYYSKGFEAESLTELQQKYIDYHLNEHIEASGYPVAPISLEEVSFVTFEDGEGGYHDMAEGFVIDWVNKTDNLISGRIKEWRKYG